MSLRAQLCSDGSMKTFTLNHEIAVAVDGFWKIFFDKDYNVALYLKGLGFPAFELVSLL